MRRTDCLKVCGALAVIVWGTAMAMGQDPSGFTEQLNASRAAIGLPPVSCFVGATPIAVQNNAAQRAMGLGHWITGGLYQCAAIGTGDTAGTLAMWLNSPAHRAIILSPALSAVGYANDGYCATVACSMGNTALSQQPNAGPAVNGAVYQPRFRFFRRCR
jgi:hypothetical protein